MNRWAGRIAVVTGASAGVGAAVAVELVKQGLTVIGVARRSDKIEQLQAQVKGAPGKLVALKGDVGDVSEVRKIFAYVRENFKTMHVLVNNAGFMLSGTFIEGDPEDWKKVLDVNVIGLATCAQEAIKLMRESGVDDGHIINVNSVAGHRIPPAPKTTFNIYPPSKYAVTAISETLRRELADISSKIRVTNLSPGYIKTEFQLVASRNDPQLIAESAARLASRPPLYPADLAAAVTYILSAPPHVQVHELGLTGI